MQNLTLQIIIIIIQDSLSQIYVPETTNLYLSRWCRRIVACTWFMDELISFNELSNISRFHSSYNVGFSLPQLRAPTSWHRTILSICHYLISRFAHSFTLKFRNRRATKRILFQSHIIDSLTFSRAARNCAMYVWLWLRLTDNETEKRHITI